ncbi:hypothetical protein D9M68_673220 [compost metagenome]
MAGLFRHAVHRHGDLVHAAVDLLGHRGLLLGGAGDLRVHRVDGADQLGDGIQRSTCLVGLLAGEFTGIAGLTHGRDRLVRAFLQAIDHPLDFLGALLSTAGQGTDFIGHHREATTGLTGTCRFDGGIERQQVGLFGDRADYIEHADNRQHILLQAVERHATLANVQHQRVNAGNAAIHHLLGRLAFQVGLLRGDSGALGTLRHLMGRRGHFIDRGGDLIGFVTLLLHGLFGALRLRRHLADQFGQLPGHLDDLPHQAVDLLDEAVE